MRPPLLIRPVVPKDDSARQNGCTCNRRSSIPGSKHHPDCALYRKDKGMEEYYET